MRIGIHKWHLFVLEDNRDAIASSIDFALVVGTPPTMMAYSTKGLSMKLAISSNDGRFDSLFSARFARCESFIIVDTETRSWETMPNPAAGARGGAGAQVVQFLADNGVEATISGRYGPTAMTALNAAGIQAFVADNGTPLELLDKLLAHKLEQVNTATGSSLHG